MKKLLILCTTLTFYATASQATGFFIGADALQTHTAFKAKNGNNTGDPQNGTVKKDDEFGYGLNAGLRGDFLNLLGSAELFYDYLNTNGTNFTANDGTANSGSTSLDNRYGLKFNAGFAILPRVTPFITLGAANVRYSSTSNATGQSLKQYEMAPLYGIGLLVDLPFGVSVKAAYDYQKFYTKYAYEGPRTRVHLGVARLGLIYNF